MTPIQQLKALYLEENRRKYPSLPEAARVAPKYSDRDSNGLTRCIIDFLRLKHYQAERISVTGRYIDNSRIVTDVIGRQRRIGSGQWIRPSMQPGSADISAVIQGQAVKIEIKLGRDKQSKAQKLYQDQIESAGGMYFIATSFDGFYCWFSQTFTPATNRAKLESNVR